MTKKTEDPEELQLKVLLFNVQTWECIMRACRNKGMFTALDPHGTYATFFKGFPLHGMKVLWDENSLTSRFSLTPELQESIAKLDPYVFHMQELGMIVERYATACSRVYGALTYLDFMDILLGLEEFDPLISLNEIKYMITTPTLSPYAKYLVDSEHTIIYNPCLFDLEKEDYWPDVRQFISESAKHPRWKPRTKRDLYKYSETYAGGKPSQALEKLLVAEWGLNTDLPMDPVYLNLYRSFANGGSVGDHLESIAPFLVPDPLEGGPETLRLVSAISAAEKDFRNPNLGGFRRGDKRPGGARKAK